MATREELTGFFKEAEKRAFRRVRYQVRDEEAALDIVQESMMKLAVHYGDRPPGELPLLFARILGNTTMDWFRANQREKEVFAHIADSASADEEMQEWAQAPGLGVAEETLPGGEAALSQKQTLALIDAQVQMLPPRQREAFLLRYWEELSVTETAMAMGCTEGSVKTHCSRACHALSQALREKGVKS